MLITLRDLRVKGSLLIFLACHRARYYFEALGVHFGRS